MNALRRPKKILIIGGTSGLGLAMAQILKSRGDRVFVTDRKDLDIGDDVEKLAVDLDRLVHVSGRIDLLIYSAGFFQQGTIARLNDHSIQKMINVGLNAPALLLQRILRKQSKLPGVILITSTSQEIPRLKEPLYAAVKAGLAMLGNSLSLDPHVGKTMVVAPAGMDTKMWRGKKRSGVLLDPRWVGQTVLDLFKKKCTYHAIRVLRDPARVVSIEKR